MENKFKKGLILGGIMAIAVAVIFLPRVAVRADSMPDSNHTVHNYLIIDNATDYSGYNFFVTYDLKAPSSQKVSAISTEVIANGVAHLIAVKQSDESNITSGAQAKCPECGDNWYQLVANQKLIASSTLSLNFSGYLPDENTVVKVTQTIHIDSLSDTTMTARLVAQNAEDKNGKKLYGFQDFTTYPPYNYTPWTTPLIIGIVVCLGIIGILAAKIVWKK